MRDHKANIVNYQARASEFEPGDTIRTINGTPGRVMAVWPAIGMVDVEFTHGNRRLPVEDVVRIPPDDPDALAPLTDNVPGGLPTVSVPGGPYPALGNKVRVAEAYVKKALYWAGRDRQYRATDEELGGGAYLCPKCKALGQDVPLRRAIYKRRSGQSERLLGCPSCLFLIKKEDVLGDPDYYEGGA
jgi:hypothetical protein